MIVIVIIITIRMMINNNNNDKHWAPLFRIAEARKISPHPALIPHILGFEPNLDGLLHLGLRPAQNMTKSDNMTQAEDPSV